MKSLLHWASTGRGSMRTGRTAREGKEVNIVNECEQRQIKIKAFAARILEEYEREGLSVQDAYKTTLELKSQMESRMIAIRKETKFTAPAP